MKRYVAVIAEYCFGFGGKKIVVCPNDKEADEVMERLAVTKPTSIEKQELQAKNRKEAFTIASVGRSIFAGPFAGMDISKA